DPAAAKASDAGREDFAGFLLRSLWQLRWLAREGPVCVAGLCPRVVIWNCAADVVEPRAESTRQALAGNQRGEPGNQRYLKGELVSLYLTPMNIGEVTVIDAAGRITLGENTMSFRKMIHDLTAGGRKKILLNMADITYVDSSGIGELIAAFTTVK